MVLITIMEVLSINWKGFNMNAAWNNLDNDNTFRLVFTDFQTPQAYNYCDNIEQMIQWRNAQELKEPELYVIKIGYSNFLQNNSLEQLTEFFFTKAYLFNNKPVRFSIYQDITQLDDFELFSKYQLMAQTLSFLNIHFTIGWIIDFAKMNYINDPNILSFLHFLNEERHYICPHINNVVVFHNTQQLYHYSILSDLYTVLLHTQKINGYDLTSKLNNIHNIVEKNKNTNYHLLSLAQYMQSNNKHFLKHVLPEINNLLDHQYNGTQELKEQIAEFCQNGYVINTQTNHISPLVYGSADDFTLPPSLPINELLLMVFQDVNHYFQNTITKLFIKSHCSSCDNLSQCQQQKIYWLNFLESKHCALELDNAMA